MSIYVQTTMMILWMTVLGSNYDIYVGGKAEFTQNDFIIGSAILMLI